MNRRSLLTLIGLVSLPLNSRSQTPPVPKYNLFLMDAPIRTTLEMLLKGFGKRNYVIANNVIGILTIRCLKQTFEEMLKNLCKNSTQGLTWINESGVIMIHAQPDNKPSQEDLTELFKQAKLPIVDGVACRMAGCFLGATNTFAILELGGPPDSLIQIVEQGHEVEVLEAKYLVEKITEKELVLKGTEKTLRIPLAPLVPKTR